MDCERTNPSSPKTIRLHVAMAERDTPLTMIHALSHHEHSETADNDLRERREAVATADVAASEAHDTHTLPIDTSGDAPFPLYYPT
jgi:hypothetical protein